MGLRRARSSRLTTALFFGDDDLVGDLCFELVKVGGGKLGVSETAPYSDAADVEAGLSVKGSVFASSSRTVTIRSLMGMTFLLSALSLLRVMLRVKRPSSSPTADMLCAFFFSVEPLIKSVSACSCLVRWELPYRSRSTRRLFAGGVGGAAGSVDSEGIPSPRTQAAMSGRELVGRLAEECCRK